MTTLIVFEVNQWTTAATGFQKVGEEGRFLYRTCGTKGYASNHIAMFSGAWQ